MPLPFDSCYVINLMAALQTLINSPVGFWYLILSKDWNKERMIRHREVSEEAQLGLILLSSDSIKAVMKDFTYRLEGPTTGIHGYLAFIVHQQFKSLRPYC